MKKLYLFLTTVMCLAFVTKAEVTYKFHFTVEEPENVTVKICDYYDKSVVFEEIELKEGLNDFEYTSVDGANMYIETTEDKVLKVHKADGSINFDVANNALKLYLSSYSWDFGNTEYTYTIKTFDAASFRPHTVKVTLDRPTGVRMTLRGGSVINTDTVAYEIPFNETYEDAISIRPENPDELIYKITADGTEIVKGDYDYTVALVDRSDEDDIKYVSEIVITQDFPEDMLCTIKLVFTNGDPGCISYVTYGDETIENFAGEEGFQVHPGKLFEAVFNREDYKILTYQENDREPVQATFLYRASEPIREDYVLTVEAEKYLTYEAYIVPDNYQAVKVTRYSYPYNVVELIDGETPITCKNDSEGNKVNVEATDGFEIEKIYDATYDVDFPLSTWSSTTVATLQEGSKLNITTTKIIRDKNVVVYVDDVTSLWYPLTISRGGNTVPSGVGYNIVDYRDKDGKITIGATGAQDGKVYRNGEPVSVYYYSYMNFENLDDNDVIKVFFVPENAIEHTVTFEMTEGALDGYEVKKDILAAVDPTEPVSAIGKTQFTIAPVSRADSDLTVTVGETAVEPEDGIYTFETEGDVTVKVTKATSGIENVICGENAKADVYNLQGIRVARQANVADVKALPAGIYVVNGQKVIVK